MEVSPAELSFGPGNWNEAKEVSVTAVADADGHDETVRVRHAVEGYPGVTAGGSVRVEVSDPDEQVATVSSTEVAVDEAGTASWTVVLDLQPPGPVTVTPSSADPGAVAVSPGVLTFTPQNWSVPQPVTVAGVGGRGHQRRDGDA